MLLLFVVGDWCFYIRLMLKLYWRMHNMLSLLLLFWFKLLWLTLYLYLLCYFQLFLCSVNLYNWFLLYRFYNRLLLYNWFLLCLFIMLFLLFYCLSFYFHVCACICLYLSMLIHYLLYLFLPLFCLCLHIWWLIAHLLSIYLFFYFVILTNISISIMDNISIITIISIIIIMAGFFFLFLFGVCVYSVECGWSLFLAFVVSFSHKIETLYSSLLYAGYSILILQLLCFICMLFSITFNETQSISIGHSNPLIEPIELALFDVCCSSTEHKLFAR